MAGLVRFRRRPARRTVFALAVAASTLLGGCAGGPGGASAPAVAVTRAPGADRTALWAYACPAVGTTVAHAAPGAERRVVAVRQVVEVDRADAAMCLVMDPATGARRWLAYEVGGSDLAPALRALLPAAPGDCAALRGLAADSTGGQPYAFRVCLRGVEERDLPVGRRRAAVVTAEYESEAQGGWAGAWEFAYDIERRALVSRSFALRRGDPRPQAEWRALRVEVRRPS